MVEEVARPPRKDVHEEGEHHHPVAVELYDLQHRHDMAVTNGTGPESGAVDNGLGSVDAFTKADKAKMEDAGIEREYEAIGVPAWRDQLTPRAFVVSVILGAIFSVITHRLSLTVGIIPSLNVSAGLLGFLCIKTYTKVATWFGFKVKPFTRQENTVIQTCVVSCYGLAFSGGLDTYLLGMSSFAAEKLKDPSDGIKNPSLSWMIPYLLVVAFLGIFVLVPLRKVMIIDYKLTYPSGTATAILINSFHTPTGAALAKKQMKYLAKYFSFSFLWSFFKWFFSGDGSCGFDTFPSLGILAYRNRFLFDFNMTYIGAGMICPHLVNCSILFGAIVSWGLMWPLINNQAGHWYDASLKPSSFRGLFGYKVFISVALILGDGLYHFVRVTIISVHGLYRSYRARNQLPTSTQAEKDELLSNDERIRNEVFLKDGVPYWVAIAGYITFAIIAIIVIPHIFPQVKWYYVLIGYIIGPVFAFSNAYGTGLTDWSLASNYGKIFLFVFATWAGSQGGGVIAGLATCGVAMTIVASAADLMQDFKTGYLTLSSPRSMFASQLIGALMGVFVAPLTFWLFYKAFHIGASGSVYQAPFAIIYRAMALVGVEGFGALPQHCLQLCAGWFAFAIVVNFIREKVPKKYSQYIPIPMAMAIPFYLGAYFAIDMFIGTCIVFTWERLNRKKAATFTAAVASGLLCGDGIWTLPAAILNFAKVNPPICMTFFPTKLATQLGYPLYSN